ncbi:putative ubiquitin conjugating enzyme E2 [Aspergillus lucknowensis]|uniref:Ubiquitin-conjugating enzyme/RWD-like protein n=1 Tax=Aspergillus lucknowensis TaxID=176173 RepID=A0ABR4M603_9EURO
MVSKLRRLAADHAELHEELPPNYLFPPEEASDDITQLTTLLAGPQGTPYSQGLWRLHLKMPEDYPKSPPKATFKTRIWHPNVEESTGAVCVDTLKRDWKPSLTLKDVLITISCLLIYPNPDSALNSTSGALLQEDYAAFARQAKLMTSIHAPVPNDMLNAVTEAKMRGEETGTAIPEQEEVSRTLRSRKGTRIQSLTMKKKLTRKEPSTTPDPETRRQPIAHHYHEPLQPLSDDENENPACASKENDPSLSPSPVKLAPPLSPRKNAHGKRPLSVLTTAVDVDPFTTETEDLDTTDGMTASERNIAANTTITTTTTPTTTPTREIPDRDPSPQRKSPKLSILSRSLNTGRQRDDTGLKIYEDTLSDDPHSCTMSGNGKGTHASSLNSSTDVGSTAPKSHLLVLPTCSVSTPSSSSNAPGSGSGSGMRKVSGSGLKKAKPRMGIRRL